MGGGVDYRFYIFLVSLAIVDNHYSRLFLFIVYLTDVKLLTEYKYEVFCSAERSLLLIVHINLVNC